MTLKDFAQLAGIKVFRCDREEGGTWAYSVKDEPGVSYVGYRSEAQLYKGWAVETLGRRAAKALIALLAETEATR